MCWRLLKCWYVACCLVFSQNCLGIRARTKPFREPPTLLKIDTRHATMIALGRCSMIREHRSVLFCHTQKMKNKTFGFLIFFKCNNSMKIQKCNISGWGRVVKNKAASNIFSYTSLTSTHWRMNTVVMRWSTQSSYHTSNCHITHHVRIDISTHTFTQSNRSNTSTHINAQHTTTHQQIATDQHIYINT